MSHPAVPGGHAPATRYAVAAALLGAGWFPLFLIPSAPREWLLDGPLRNLAFLCVSSVLVAVALRRFILGATTFWEHLWRAVVVPFVGAFVYLTLVAAAMWTRQLLYGGLTNLYDTGSMYLFGMVMAVLAFPLTISYGLVCQYLLHAVARTR